MTEEQKQKMRKPKSVKPTLEQRQAQSKRQKGRTPWNKGKTKDNDPGMLKSSNTKKAQWKNGRIHPNKGKTLSDEAKATIKASMNTPEYRQKRKDIAKKNKGKPRKAMPASARKATSDRVKNSMWVTCIETNKASLILKQDLDQYLDNGYHIGRPTNFKNALIEDTKAGKYTGMKWIHKQNEKSLKVLAADVPKYLENGWELGKK